jgi:hypothetical protein
MIIPIVIPYQVKNSNDPISFELIIGDAHIGTSLLHLDNDLLPAPNPENGSFKRVIGTNQAINGKTLYCTTTIAIEANNPQVDVTINITGGVSNYSKTNSQTAADNDAVAQYAIQVMFYSA